MLYYIIDLETSGLVLSYNEIVEVSIIRVDDRMQLTKNVKASHPERASLDALRIIGKTKYQLSQGLYLSEAVNLCTKFINSDGAKPNQRCMIAHNAAFDRKFCLHAWKEQGIDFPADYWVDTMAMMRSYNKKSGIKAKVNLQDSLDSLAIVKVAGLHNAKSDTQNTYKLWKKLTEDLGIDYLPFIQNHAVAQNSDEDLQELLHSEDSGE